MELIAPVEILLPMAAVTTEANPDTVDMAVMAVTVVNPVATVGTVVNLAAMAVTVVNLVAMEGTAVNLAAMAVTVVNPVAMVEITDPPEAMDT